jgi:hypothetical protein
MSGVSCLGGHTQILRTLKHALAETVRERVNAVILIGDAIEEDVDPICHVAGQLGLRGTPVFVFQEGTTRSRPTAFRQVAKLSGRRHAPFDAASAEALRDLLRAVATYAAGGRAGAAAALGRLRRGTSRASCRRRRGAEGVAWLALGALGLVGVLALLRLFADAKPAQVRQALVWGGGILGAGLVVLLLRHRARRAGLLGLRAVRPALWRCHPGLGARPAPSPAAARRQPGRRERCRDGEPLHVARPCERRMTGRVKAGSQAGATSPISTCRSC